ncbi:hypothetical protein CO081_00665 [Candidatus Pacearchaeota archaeon CG_4_9_14_0_8_um_filter_35_24]|nr:MAG: hypothetical protein CO081_00665 [Candidatus Pacearchaeota archaeon CG_4_9_14_0_8_um_filter_35_24]
MDKKGFKISSKSILIIAGVLVAILIVMTIWHNFCSVPPGKKPNFFKKILACDFCSVPPGKKPNFFKKILACDEQTIGPVDTVLVWVQKKIGIKKTVEPTAWVADKLGFNQGIYEFLWPSFPWGLYVGALIWLSYMLMKLALNINKKVDKVLEPFKSDARRRRDIRKLQSGWLNLIGGSYWKIIPVGLIIAILLQVPFIYTFINIITFQVLGLNWFFQGILMAFYIGLLPGAIEAYTRYRTRMRYYKKIMEAKYGVRIARGMAQGG